MLSSLPSGFFLGSRQDFTAPVQWCAPKEGPNSGRWRLLRGEKQPYPGSKLPQAGSKQTAKENRGDASFCLIPPKRHSTLEVSCSLGLLGVTGANMADGGIWSPAAAVFPPFPRDLLPWHFAGVWPFSPFSDRAWCRKAIWIDMMGKDELRVMLIYYIYVSSPLLIGS